MESHACIDKTRRTHQKAPPHWYDRLETIQSRCSRIVLRLVGPQQAHTRQANGNEKNGHRLVR